VLFGGGKLILLAADDANFQNALWDTNPGDGLTVYAHGSENTLNGSSASSFARYLRVSGYWKSGQTIILDSCLTGSGEGQNFASSLAKILSTNVIAPTGRVMTYGVLSGNFEGFHQTTDGSFLPKVTTLGSWRTYGPNGKLVSSSVFR
jgi:hypothetical protein